MAEASPIIEEFQSTPPAWGATSIFCMPAPWLPIFQSTPPRMGSDPPHFYSNNDIMEFQSTLPAWGATSAASRTVSAQDYFNPRSPHGERLVKIPSLSAICIISIHAPRMGSDMRRRNTSASPIHFNPRSPHGERPNKLVQEKDIYNFNPRSPHGERHT